MADTDGAPAVSNLDSCGFKGNPMTMTIRMARAFCVTVMLTAGTALARPLAVAQLRTNDRHVVAYVCANGKSLTVTYWNADNGQSFALVPIDGKPLLLVSTLAASGVKYQGAKYTWWTKGNNADLYDETAPKDASPLLAGCSVSSQSKRSTAPGR